MRIGYTVMGNDGTLYDVDDVTGEAIGYMGADGVYVSLMSGPVLPSGASDADWVKMISEAAPKVLQLWNAQQIAQINIERAARGLAPLNPAGYGPQVAVTMSPQSQQMLLYGALAVGAYMVLAKKHR